MVIKRQESPRPSQDAKIDALIDIFKVMGIMDYRFSNYLIALDAHRDWVEDTMVYSNTIMLKFSSQKAAKAALSVLTDDEGGHAGDEIYWFKYSDDTWWLSLTWDD